MNFLNYIKTVVGITAFSLVFFSLPLMLMDSEIALGYLAGIPPQLFVTLSWIAGWEYAQRNCPDKVFLFTLGAMPIRMLVEIAWFVLLLEVSTINIGVAVGSAMMHFALYSIPQVMCIQTALTTKGILHTAER
tara:strand:+ start:21188 stop:21586 length:399 start_codon:yes stop_codon:yes gene_type:complete